MTRNRVAVRARQVHGHPEARPFSSLDGQPRLFSPTSSGLTDPSSKTQMATFPDDLERRLTRAARIAGLDGPALYWTVALGKAALAARLTPLALNPEEVRGRTERLKRDLVSCQIT